MIHCVVKDGHESHYPHIKENVLDIYLNVKEADLKEVDDKIKVALLRRSMVNNHVVPHIKKFLSPNMTNVMRGVWKGETC